MFSILSFIYQDSPSPSTLNHSDGFSRLYQTGLEKLRTKNSVQEFHNLNQAYLEVQSLQDHPKILEMSSKLSKNRLNDVYDQNMKWLFEKEEKIRRAKTFRFSQNERKHENMLLNNININLPYNYSGPISGWEERANHFNQKKNNPNFSEINHEEGVSFKPTLNENSRKIFEFRSNAGERVEERLIKQGKDAFKKKEVLKVEIEKIKELENERVGKQRLTKNELNKISDRMHGFAKEIISKREKIDKNIYQKLTFRPKLNAKSLLMNIKRKPLFEQKNNNISEIPHKEVKKDLKSFDKEKFKFFLTRNKETLSNKLSTIESRKRELESAELLECSFHPKINKNSVDILLSANNFESNIVKRQSNLNEKTTREKDQLKTMMESKIFEECTFKPKLLPYDKNDIIYRAHSVDTAKKREGYKYRNRSGTPDIMVQKDDDILERLKSKNYKNKHLDKRSIVQDFHDIENEINELMDISANLDIM